MIATKSKPRVVKISKQDPETLRWLVRHWAARLGVRAPSIQLRPMQTKWASISTSGRLTLSTELFTLPHSLNEFVVVHELVHLLAPNHSKLFKSFMSAYLPDWEKRAARLRRYEIKSGSEISLKTGSRNFVAPSI